METTSEFLRSLGVSISRTGRRLWPDAVKARAVAETLLPGATVNDVAAKYGVRANHVSEWRRLARIEQVIEPDSIKCPCGCGAMHRIGEDRSERLDILPAQLRVIVTVRPKYACRACTDGVTHPSVSKTEPDNEGIRSSTAQNVDAKK